MCYTSTSAPKRLQRYCNICDYANLTDSPQLFYVHFAALYIFPGSERTIPFNSIIINVEVT